jgi:hypothetical protein
MNKFFNKLGKFFSECGRLIVDLLTDRAKENGNVRKISLGRVCFLILFVVSIHIWLGGADIATNMLIVLTSLLGYVFGNQINATLKALKGVDLGSGKNNSQVITINPDNHGD